MADLAERVQALREAAEADEAFRSALVEAIQSRNVAEGIRLTAEKGIEFSAEELAPESQGRDLDDAELEAVAGGGGGFWGMVGKGTACVVLAVVLVFAT